MTAQSSNIGDKMKAIYTGKGVKTVDGYSFQVSFLGLDISCFVSRGALQDVDPDNRFNSEEQQFLSNQQYFVEMAERAIIAAIPPKVTVA
ncbi:hypothetical protein [Stenotrophomonas maltophilia]|uniref:hypothetical protein n=1 Tax=Stenotrophomonas maltophilia TaxID=40324 RepID=UPI002E779786|nr:hypothetical protein [Stenotrophomonas maltophilia]